MSSIRTPIQIEFISVSTVMLSIGTSSVLLRSVARFFILRKPGLDDLFIIAGWVLSVGYFAECTTALLIIMGKPKSDYTPEGMVTLLKLTLSFEITYFVIIACVKISICFQYLRLISTSVSSTFRLLCNATIIVITIYTVIFLIATGAQCIPLKKYWDLTGRAPGHCFDPNAFHHVVPSVHIATDVWLIALPMRKLLQMSLPREDKVVLVVVFGIGAFSCIASIVRLYSIQLFTKSTDIPKGAIPVNLWSFVEVHLGILCASVPAMRPLFRTAFRHRPRYVLPGDDEMLQGQQNHNEGTEARIHNFRHRDSADFPLSTFRSGCDNVTDEGIIGTVTTTITTSITSSTSDSQEPIIESVK
ncbi:hypothetical protein FQN51_000038 [Onygenales sp. PD_10]|nr:hypothetical protein FQN51_000038 [Onygenales sp. PD_10]